MAWSVWGERHLTLPSSGTINAYQKFSPDDDIFLRGSQHWLIFQGNPTFTVISMHVFSDDGSDAPRALVKTSSKSWTEAQIIAAGTQLDTGSSFTDLRNGPVKLS